MCRFVPSSVKCKFELFERLVKKLISPDTYRPSFVQPNREWMELFKKSPGPAEPWYQHWARKVGNLVWKGAVWWDAQLFHEVLRANRDYV